MTAYGSGDLNQDWEFKIVRANTQAFRRTKVLNRLLEEEARAGWVMVEKFDNTRIRFKRLRKARLDDDKLPRGVDPYRVHFGMSPVVFALALILIILGVLGAIFVSIYVVMGPP